MYGLLMLPNGKVLLFGGFSMVNGQPRQSLARMNSDGSLWIRLSPFCLTITGFTAYLQSVALQADGKVVIGGRCDMIPSAMLTSNRVARTDGDGTWDNSFTVTSSVMVRDQRFLSGLLVQPDRRILIGGDFVSYAGQPRLRAARCCSAMVRSMPFRSRQSARRQCPARWRCK
jgi:hypothetical protein